MENDLFKIKEDAIGQVLRYMGYVKEKLAKPED